MEWFDENLLKWINQNLILFIGICVAVFLLLLLLIILLIKRNKKPKIKKINIDEEFIKTLLQGLGGLTNIKEMTIDNGRLKFNINNLKLLDKEAIDVVSQSGVFITGSSVKMLFKYDSNDIKNALEGEIKNDKKRIQNN